MHVEAASASEHRAVLHSLIDLVNEVDGSGGEPDLRSTLRAHAFSRADEASTASLRRLTGRLVELAPFVATLPDTEIAAAAARVSEELTEIPITPTIVDHGGSGPHIHWTPATARFDDQVMADLLMALAEEICDNGTIRFGACGADGCDRLFYDSTRNRSKRFCSDPRCASRTHTADHRARQRD